MTVNRSLSPFALHVKEGLTANPKRISSRFLYDDEGSRLFEQIMAAPEYYLTRAEMEIFKNRSPEIISCLTGPFNLIELGPGNGVKTRYFLTAAKEAGKISAYYPVDISREALDALQHVITSKHCKHIRPIEAEYIQGLNQLKDLDERKLVLFMGSNIGNFTDDEIRRFFDDVSKALRKGDHFIAGFDLKKDPALIRAAYNDTGGVTRAFNLNLLVRMNRELDADFDPDAFVHRPTYDPATGEARSHLMSTRTQTVHIGLLGLDVRFEASELIHTEISRKFDVSDITAFARDAGFTEVKAFHDSRKYFADVLYRKD